MVVLLSLIILFSMDQNNTFEEDIAKLFNFNKKYNVEIIESKRHVGSYFINENKVYISKVKGKISKEVYSHELTHYIFHNDEDYNIYNHFFYRELIPDIVSLNYKELKFGCEKIFSRKNYPFITFSNFLEHSQGSTIIDNTKRCCSLSNSDFCNSFKLPNNYSYYPRTVQFSVSHYIGLPVLNFFNKMNDIEPDLVKKFLLHLKEEKSLYALDTFRKKIINLKEYDYYWDYYQMSRYKDVIRELENVSNANLSER